MVQSINSTQKIEETDGLPMPQRIWAVVSVGFALCMSVLDINIVNIVLPTLSHDFGTSPAVTTWIINGYQLAIVISLLSFSALGEIIGYRKVFLSGIGLLCITSLICALSVPSRMRSLSVCSFTRWTDLPTMRKWTSFSFN